MAIKGNLRDMSLHDLIQFFRMGARSGILGLTNGPDSGLIYVYQGRVVDAIVVRRTNNTVLAVADEAVILMFLWDDAKFAFRHDSSAQEYSILVSQCEECLEQEAIRRRIAQGGVVCPSKITLDTPLELVALDHEQHNISIDLTEWRIISRIPRCITLRAICRDDPSIEPDVAMCTVQTLIQKRLVNMASFPFRSPNDHSYATATLAA